MKVQIVNVAKHEAGLLVQYVIKKDDKQISPLIQVQLRVDQSMAPADVKAALMQHARQQAKIIQADDDWKKYIGESWEIPEEAPKPPEEPMEIE